MEMDTDAAFQQVRLYAVADLRFDPENPRLPRHIDGASEGAVLGWMLTDATLPELMGSIGSQGYFPGEPILIVPSDLTRPHEPPYLVVEGNRRLAATLLLLHPESAPVRRSTVEAVVNDARIRPDRLPALWYPRRQDVLDYLGYRHITGVQEWSPLSKARYLRQLVDEARATGGTVDYREIARKIGSRHDYVRRLLGGLTVFDRVQERDYYNLDGVDEPTVDFSVLTTALSYSAIASWVGVDVDGEADQLNDRNLKDLIDWTYRERAGGRTIVGESRNLSSLAKVVSQPEALTALREGSTLADAALLTDEPLEIFRQSIHDAQQALARARGQIHRVEPTPADLTLVSETVVLAKDLAAVVRTRLEGSDDA